ncbi:hypothetical protein PENSPDRAFT_691217 [Peniophora sp. CONT]|nr:hypothetical protein PENSPDRAFT_691217 [Peniophora sp. CONT]
MSRPSLPPHPTLVAQDVVDQFAELDRARRTSSQVAATLMTPAGLIRSASSPKNLWNLVKKAIFIRKHLDTVLKDKDCKVRLVLVNERVHRPLRYFNAKQPISPSFEPSTTWRLPRRLSLKRLCALWVVWARALM